MSDEAENGFLALTAEIVSAHVANNSVHTGDLPKLIATVHAALSGLGAPTEALPAEPEHKPAVGVRKSLANDEHIISMIDGKPYRTLRRHLSKHGLTDKEYRARYNLPADYPMVARPYSAARAAMAKAIGLGRKAGEKVGDAAKAAAAQVEQAVAPAAGKGRKSKQVMPKAAEAAPPPSKRRSKAAE